MRKIIILIAAFFLSGCLATIQEAVNSTANMVKKVGEFTGVDNTTFKRVGNKRIKEINIYPSKYTEEAGRYGIYYLGQTPKESGKSRKIYKLPIKKITFHYDESGYLSMQTLETPNVKGRTLEEAHQDEGVYLKVDETTKYVYDKNTGRVKVYVTKDGINKEYSYRFEHGYPTKYYAHENGQDKLLKEFQYDYGVLKMESEGSRYTKYKYGKWDAVTIEKGNFADADAPATTFELSKLNFKFDLVGGRNQAVAAHQTFTHKVGDKVLETMQIDSSVIDEMHKAPTTTPLSTPLNKYENLVYDENGYILSLLNKDVHSMLYTSEIIEFVYEDGPGNAKFFNPPKDLDEQLGFIKYY